MTSGVHSNSISILAHISLQQFATPRDHIKAVVTTSIYLSLEMRSPRIAQTNSWFRMYALTSSYQRT